MSRRPNTRPLPPIEEQMSRTKRFLEEISERMGKDGVIDNEVIDKAADDMATIVNTQWIDNRIHKIAREKLKEDMKEFRNSNNSIRRLRKLL